MDDLNMFRQCGHLRSIVKFSADSEKRLKVQATDTLLLRGEPGGRAKQNGGGRRGSGDRARQSSARVGTVVCRVFKTLSKNPSRQA